MNVTSVALTTELALAASRGRVVDRGDCIVVETPDDPGWQDGNYLVVPRAPRAGELAGAIARFVAELGAQRAPVLRWDDPRGTPAPERELVAAGLVADRFDLMTAREVVAPPSDAIAELDAGELAAASELAWLLADRHDDAYRQFLARRTAWQAALVARGRARFFAVRERDAVVASVGLVDVAPGLARYQDVQVAPGHRRRGLAGALLAAAARASSATRFAIVAEPGGAAARVYARVGFAVAEHAAGAHRALSG